MGEFSVSSLAGQPVSELIIVGQEVGDGLKAPNRFKVLPSECKSGTQSKLDATIYLPGSQHAAMPIG